MNCHTDEPLVRYPVSMNICSDTQWPIKLRSLWKEVVAPGDGVAYLGTIVPHWRSPLRTHDNDRFMQLFLHYVRKNGQYAEYAYDKKQRCYLIYSISINKSLFHIFLQSLYQYLLLEIQSVKNHPTHHCITVPEIIGSTP